MSHAVFRCVPLTPLASALSMMTAGLPMTALAMQELGTVEVSAQALRESAFSVAPAMALEELQKTPGGAAVVDARDFQNGRTGSLEDTLRLATGVFVASRFGSDEARISIRGSGLQRTFHGRGLMLLQDGVPLNLADGSFDMQSVEPFATRYVEVERGASALRHGGATLGGAINYVSQTGRTAPPLVLRAEAGSFGYQRYGLAVAGSHESLDGYAAFSHLDQDGYRHHARQRNGRFFGNVGLQLSDRVESRFYLTVVDTDSELPGNLTYAQLKADARQANPRAEARDQKRDFSYYRVANRTQWRHEGGGVTEVIGYASKKQLYHPIEFFPNGPGLIEQDNRDVGLGIRHVALTRWLGGSQEHVAGANWHRGLTQDERYTYASNGFPAPGAATGNRRGTLDNRQKQTADAWDVYAQSSWTVHPAWTAVAGAQSTVATRRQTVLEDAVGFDPGTGAVRLPTGSYEERYTRTSPRLGLIYRLGSAIEVYGNVSGSFEPPSFSETLNNQPLRAQRATTIELGLRGDRALSGLTAGWDLSVYRARVRNELLEVALNGGQPATVNADRTRHQGIEAGLRLEGARWRALGNYLYNDFRFTGEDGFAGNRIAGVPDQLLQAELAWRFPGGIWAGPTLRAASRSWIDHANTAAAPGYAVYGVKVNQTLASGLSWFVEGRNLTDKTYAATHGVVRDLSAPGVNQAQYSPGDGRALYVGVSKAF